MHHERSTDCCPAISPACFEANSRTICIHLQSSRCSAAGHKLFIIKLGAIFKPSGPHCVSTCLKSPPCTVQTAVPASHTTHSASLITLLCFLFYRRLWTPTFNRTVPKTTHTSLNVLRRLLIAPIAEESRLCPTLAHSHRDQVGCHIRDEHLIHNWTLLLPEVGDDCKLAVLGYSGLCTGFLGWHWRRRSLAIVTVHRLSLGDG